MNNSRFVLVAVLLLCAVPFASAGIIQVDWYGAVTYSPHAGIIDRGDTIMGSYIYNSDSSPISSDTNSTVYATNHQSTFSVNGLIVDGSEGQITVDNDLVVCPTFSCVRIDGVIVESNSFTGNLLGGYSVESLFLSFGDLGGPLSDTSLPLSDPGFFNSFAFGQIWLSSGGGVIYFNIEDDAYSNLSTVPLPGTSALLGLGLASLILFHRKVYA